LSLLTTLTPQQQTVRDLSDRLVLVQQPVRILDAINWDDTVRRDFYASGESELPRVDLNYYANRELGFDPVLKRQELLDLELEIRRKLGEYSPVGSIMRRMCREYGDVVQMLAARGTPTFSLMSRELYGSPLDAFHAGEPTLADFGWMMADALGEIDRSGLLAEEPRTIPGSEAVAMLQERLAKSMPGLHDSVSVIPSDGIVSDAAAGSDYIKLRSDAMFNERDIRLLEVHEGWVHLATTLNGRSQPICTFLSKGPPSATVTQEGLAVFVENLSLATHPERLRRVSNRILAVSMAEQGADFLEVYRFLLDQEIGRDDAFTIAARAFRGSLPNGGPFTKDVSYSKGFVLVYNYLQLAVRKGKLDRVPLLFCGKTTLEDLHILAGLVEEGLVEPPAYLPPVFENMHGLVAWMCYSGFLRRLRLESIEADYAAIL
jgi:uncharacterized protein (TIGR02421 family)